MNRSLASALLDIDAMLIRALKFAFVVSFVAAAASALDPPTLDPPHIDAPTMDPPHVEAPHVEAPQVEAPHMTPGESADRSVTHVPIGTMTPAPIVTPHSTHPDAAPHP